jgi:hypothetical protein
MPEVFFELLGDDFAVDAAIADSSLREYARVQHRSETMSRQSGKTDAPSGLQISLGDDEDAGLEQQVAEAMKFLEDEAAEIRRLCSFPGVQVARLRFGVFWSEDTGAKFSSFPSALLLKCGELRLDIVLCEYDLGTQPESTEPRTAPNGGPATQVDKGAPERRPSVS